MNQLLQAMNRPDEGALCWDNLAVQIPTKKIYLWTPICDGQKRKKKKNLKKSRQLMRYLKHGMHDIRAHGGSAPPSPPQLFEKKKKEKQMKRYTHFQIKGIFDGIRIFDWQTSPKHPN